MEDTWQPAGTLICTAVSFCLRVIAKPQLKLKQTCLLLLCRMTQRKFSKQIDVVPLKL